MTAARPSRPRGRCSGSWRPAKPARSRFAEASTTWSTTWCTDGRWRDPFYTAPGFPRVFYLKYHGYSQYFPLWALARYRNFLASVEPKG